jgi:hypothetical protein
MKSRRVSSKGAFLRTIRIAISETAGTVQKPDFVIRRGHRIAAILDAKYRDLWENPLPPEMLYQFIALCPASTVHGRKAVILYPTLSSEAREQAILIRAYKRVYSSYSYSSAC